MHLRYTVAAVQYEPQFGAREYNVNQLVRLIRQAARAGARLVVLPEMAATGYCFRNRAEIAPLVEPVPGGPTVEALVKVAAAESLYVVAGLPEVEPTTGAFYNSAVLVGPKGYVGKYRKTHLYIDDTRWARDGDLGMPVFETELGRIGVAICMDLDYWETARLAALAGADLIAFPTNWLGNQTAWRARALENGVYVVAANRWGEEKGTVFCGNSAVLDPQGSALNLLSTGDGLALAEVDTDLARQARGEALSRRRPHLYQELLVNSYLWSWRNVQQLPPGRPVAVAVGETCDGTRLADALRWADKRVRDQNWPGLDLAVFPACSGEVPDADLLQAAGHLGCHVVWGTRDRVWLAGPSGVLAEYRTGDDLVTVELPWGRVGLLAGSDLLTPEPARILAKRGCDLIAAPAAWVSEHDRLLWFARAMENNTALALANAHGGSLVVRPAPRPYVARVEAPDPVAVAQFDTGSDAVRAKELLRKLQPRWYEPLTQA